MSARSIMAVMIEPGRIPVPTEISSDIVELANKVNIDRHGKPHSEFGGFEILEIKDGVNIVSSPKGEERGLPVTRTVGRYSKFYGIIYLVKMNGFNLMSMTREEAIDYCIKFMDDIIPMERLGLPPVDYGSYDD